MQLKQIVGKSKKTGKEYTAYYIAIGKYKTPLFFPSEIELDYIQRYIAERAHKDFKGDDLKDVEGE
ncbi:hypothetical protein IJG29_03795 [Candidatus Saccharibacteria bacterium]|nr:hypothetical protein [Candidatus Saccharibacteria bacterium]